MVRVNNKGEIKDSAPCVDCTHKMKEFNIKKIIYSNNDGDFTTCKVCDYETDHVANGRKHLSNRVSNHRK